MSSAWKLLSPPSRALLVVGVVALTCPMFGGETRAEAQSRERHDLRDLQRLLELVQRLYPGLDPSLRMRAWLGYLGQERGYLQTVDLTLFVEANPGATPERVVYGGAARFDTSGHLDVYSGSTTAGKERFEGLKRELSGRLEPSKDARTVLRAMEAPFADSGPTLSKCRALEVLLNAVGPIVHVGDPSWSRDPTTLIAMSGELRREHLIWTLDVIAKRRSGRQHLRIEIDPWGEVVGVTPLGEPGRE
jgi:hypothetical protein